MASGSPSSGSVPLPRELISSGSPSSGGGGSASAPLGLRRGLISCLHSLGCGGGGGGGDSPLLADEYLPESMYKLIVGFYDEAFDRLRMPCKSIPDLFGLLSSGGYCLGLLDPVSNIILNTIALLPRHAAASPSTSTSPRPKKRWRPGFDPWHEIAIRSYQSQLAFLMAYFGCLTKVQATRYLYRADANLLLALMLLHHDLYMDDGQEEEAQLGRGRTQAALEWAATKGGHPSPTTLAQLMTIRLNRGGDDLNLLEQHFSADGRGTPLTTEDVLAIHSLLRSAMTPMCVAAISSITNGLVVHVHHKPKATLSLSTTTHSNGSTTADTAATTTSTTYCWDGNTPISALQFNLTYKLQACLATADGQKHFLKTRPCDDDGACDYVQSLKMYLYGIIHSLYLKVFKLLPCTFSGSFMRSILVAGHCYGPYDPVSNIILNAAWYHSRLPIASHDKLAEYKDVLDPMSLLRLAVRSLKGLVKLALSADPQASIPCVLEKLCASKCLLVLDLPSSASQMMNPFHEAAMAAGHPMPLELGELHKLLLLPLMHHETPALLRHITDAQTSLGVLRLDDIQFYMSDMWRRSKPQTSGTVQLSQEALKLVSNRRLVYEERRSGFRSKIEHVLRDYTNKHFWEPSYKLDIILGVEESNQSRPPYSDVRYRVNFMATYNLELQRTLFFAEFWSSPKPKPEFCCALPDAYVGRCFYGVHTATKIMYPDGAQYIPDDITRDGTGGVDDMIEMDLVHFSSELDVEIARNLNIFVNEEDSE